MIFNFCCCYCFSDYYYFYYYRNNLLFVFILKRAFVCLFVFSWNCVQIVIHFSLQAAIFRLFLGTQGSIKPLCGCIRQPSPPLPPQLIEVREVLFTVGKPCCIERRPRTMKSLFIFFFLCCKLCKKLELETL